MTRTNDSPAAGVTWDLGDLYAGPADPRLAADLDAAMAAAQQFAGDFRGRIGTTPGPAPAVVLEAVTRLEAILEQVGRAVVFADLLHAADATVAEHGALVAHTQDLASAIRRELIFFELEWIALEDDAARRIIEAPECARYRHFLASLRRYRPHVLSEPEERVLELKANTGARAFARLFDELVAELSFEVTVDGESKALNESETLALLYDERREVRRAAAAALTAGLQDNQLVIGFVFNTLVHDHAGDDRLRRFTTPMSARHLANEIDAGTVEALMNACEARHDIVHRYYALKRRLLGLDELLDYDRYAPVAADNAAVPWQRCREIVLDAYGGFAPRMRELATWFFERRWIDAEVRNGKRGGAFSASTVTSAHPYVLVNYTGTRHDVLTVAHELGHGVHQYLSQPRGYLQADTPLTLAETASVFGEMLVFEHLLGGETDRAAQLGLLCGKIEDAIATVFRQVALTRFEERLHAARRAEGELARNRICTLWQDTNAALYGTSVRLTEDYRWWWAYISHFVHTPFYCYAYGFGELLVLALYELYRREGSSFVPRYLDLLAAGGSAPPDALLRPFGLDIRDPGFWNMGLEPLAAMVTRVEELIDASGAALVTSP
ncbi:M3 family oligoendopeptidase [Candidatus Binatia bacterium]|nr:M3 family oligoendopeptidase [Candidatus Binatia bacterium]